MPNNPSSLQARRDAMVQEKMTELGLKYSCDMDPEDWMSMCEEAKDACLSDLLRQLDELGRALAESEAKVKALNAELAANAALEAKLLSADDALMECFSIACLQGGAYRISREAEAAYGDACDRYEARKKGAEHE